MTERNVCDFGADPSGRQVSTAAIQRAIAETGHNDTLVIPAGRFLTGSLFLKSGMTLHLEAGAQLLGSQSLDDYPLIDTRVAGIDMRWPAAIINIIKRQYLYQSGARTGGGVKSPQRTGYCHS